MQASAPTETARRGKISRRAVFSFSLVILVIIDQAAVRQDPALGVGHRTELDGELHQTAVRLDGHGVQLVRGLQQRLAVCCETGGFCIIAEISTVCKKKLPAGEPSSASSL